MLRGPLPTRPGPEELSLAGHGSVKFERCSSKLLIRMARKRFRITKFPKITTWSPMTYDSMTYPLSQQNVEELRAMRGGRTKVPSLEQISDRLNAAAMCVQGPPASPWHASHRTSPCSSSRLSKRTCAALLKLTPACEDLEDGDEAPTRRCRSEPEEPQRQESLQRSETF